MKAADHVGESEFQTTAGSIQCLIVIAFFQYRCNWPCWWLMMTLTRLVKSEWEGSRPKLKGKWAAAARFFAVATLVLKQFYMFTWQNNILKKINTDHCDDRHFSHGYRLLLIYHRSTHFFYISRRPIKEDPCPESLICKLFIFFEFLHILHPSRSLYQVYAQDQCGRTAHRRREETYFLRFIIRKVILWPLSPSLSLLSFSLSLSLSSLESKVDEATQLYPLMD